MKSNPELQTIPVVILTGSGAKEDIQRAYQHGCNAYVIKPGSPEKFRLFASMIETFWFVLGRVPGG